MKTNNEALFAAAEAARGVWADDRFIFRRLCTPEAILALRDVIKEQEGRNNQREVFYGNIEEENNRLRVDKDVAIAALKKTNDALQGCRTTWADRAIKAEEHVAELETSMIGVEWCIKREYSSGERYRRCPFCLEIQEYGHEEECIMLTLKNIEEVE